MLKRILISYSDSQTRIDFGYNSNNQSRPVLKRNLQKICPEEIMKRNYILIPILFLMIAALLFCACTSSQKQFLESDKTFADMDAYEQEETYEYSFFFLPKPFNGIMPGYVGDTMPYYEDGTYYIYYLKEAGGSFNHSIYLAATKDFVTYTDYEDPILEANYEGGQDGWIGTGSVVRIGAEYIFFYTAHASAGDFEYKEKIMAAKGSSLTGFEKIAGWELIPPDELGQKNDFRDPQAYYDTETGSIILTVTAAQDGIARILKFTLSPDLSEAVYDGIIFTDPTGDFWNLECSDTFCMNDRCYLTYSGQDDTLWYAVSDQRYGPYTAPQRLEGKVFYAAKHVEDGENVYMAGWARRSESLLSAGPLTGWAGNLVVQQVRQNADGSLYLEAPSAIRKNFTIKRPLLVKNTSVLVESKGEAVYTDVFTAYERFMLTGKFTFACSGSFGLAFDFDESHEDYKLISLDPESDKVGLYFSEGKTLIAENTAALEPGKQYTFTYLQEGSVGLFYIDGLASLNVRLYGVSGKPIRLFAENSSVKFTNLAEFTN